MNAYWSKLADWNRLTLFRLNGPCRDDGATQRCTVFNFAVLSTHLQIAGILVNIFALPVSQTFGKHKPLMKRFVMTYAVPYPSGRSWLVSAIIGPWPMRFLPAMQSQALLWISESCVWDSGTLNFSQYCTTEKKSLVLTWIPPAPLK